MSSNHVRFIAYMYFETSQIDRSRIDSSVKIYCCSVHIYEVDCISLPAVDRYAHH